MAFENLFGRKNVVEDEDHPIEILGTDEPTIARNIQEEVFEFLKKEFKAEDAPQLKSAKDSNSPPLSILRSDGLAFSMWYRLPLRGESGAVHIPDFVLFNGVHRMAPRDRNPDIVIECRELPDEKSNRTDSRTVRDSLGFALDALPGRTVLITNRAVSDYAKSLANSYGINVLNTINENARHDLFRLLIDDTQVTREKLYAILDKSIMKLERKFKAVKKAAHIKKAAKLGKSELRDLVVNALGSKQYSATRLSSILNVHETVILNELYVLEREGRAVVSKKSQHGSAGKDEWALNRSS